MEENNIFSRRGGMWRDTMEVKMFKWEMQDEAGGQVRWNQGEDGCVGILS